MHNERHYISRTGWLRAAVLGANDGIISVSSLVIGVAAASVDTQSLLITGVAGLVAGAMSMAAGEYVSVSSQSDLENADRVVCSFLLICDRFCLETFLCQSLFQSLHLRRVGRGKLKRKPVEFTGLQGIELFVVDGRCGSSIDKCPRHRHKSFG